MWNEYKSAQDGLEESIIVMDELIEGVREFGSEQLPGAVKGKLRALAATMQLSGKSILDTGALSQDELELLNAIIADPTATFQTRSNKEILAGYETIMDKLQRGLRRNNQNTQFWPGLGSNLDQMTPSQKRRQQAAALQQQQADELGLVDQPPAIAPNPQLGFRGRGPAGITQAAPVPRGFRQ